MQNCLAVSRTIAENVGADVRQMFDDAIRDYKTAWRDRLATAREDDRRR
jgi:hypothetical protein